MFHGKKVATILLMAGNGFRMGSSTPKQFLRINGQKLYTYTLSKLKAAREIDEILLVCPKDWVANVQEENPSLRVIAGGKTRQESVKLGLLSLQTDIVVVHDAVRPFVSQRILRENISLATKKGAVNTCVSPADTVSLQKNQETIVEIPPRADCLLGQTPQTFSYSLLRKAHEKAEDSGVNNATDDCSLVLKMGHAVHVVKGEQINFKITTELDLELAKHLLSKKKCLPSPKISLEGKSYIVIGASGGIGQEIADLLEKEGALAIPSSRSSSDYPMDLEKPATIKKTLQKIYERFGEVDGLINTAGYLTINALENLSSLQIEQMININLTGVIYACKCAFLKDGGHITSLSSSSFTRGRAGYSIYSACKAAIINFMEALAAEKPLLRVNTIIPPRCSTNMRFTNFPGEDPKTLLCPKVVAKTAISLLKDPHITGSIIELKMP